MSLTPAAGDWVTFRHSGTTLEGRVVGIGGDGCRRPGDRYLVRLADGELVPVAPAELGAVVEPEPAGHYWATLTGEYDAG